MRGCGTEALGRDRVPDGERGRVKAFIIAPAGVFWAGAVHALGRFLVLEKMDRGRGTATPSTVMSTDSL